MIRKLRAAALLLALVSCALPLPAAATVLYMGGEDNSCQLIGTVSVSTTSGNFRSGYAREALGVSFSSFLGDPMVNRCLTPAFTSQASGWIHAETIAGSAGTDNRQNAVEIYGPDGVMHWVVRGTGVSGEVKLSKKSTAGVYTDLVTCSAVWPSTSLHAIDIFLNVAASGEFALFVDGVSAGCDYLGDTRQDSQTAFNQVDFSCGGITASACYWSEIAIATTDLRGVGIATCVPQATGNAWNFSGGVANINTTSINDANAVATSSSGQLAQWTCPSLPAGSYSYPAVALSPRLVVGATGPQHDAPVIRPATGSADYLGSDFSVTTSFLNYLYIWQTNPATGTGFTAADFGTGFNLGIESRP